MAVKRSMKKAKAAPITRAFKRKGPDYTKVKSLKEIPLNNDSFPLIEDPNKAEINMDEVDDSVDLNDDGKSDDGSYESAEPVKRSIKRAPSQAVTSLDEVLDPMVDAADAEVDFMEAPLTPKQQAEKDALEGANAAATAGNLALPERQSIADRVRGFQERNKSKASYQEFMALSPEERAVILDEEQKASKAKRRNK